jgi:hypothetical protein
MLLVLFRPSIMPPKESQKRETVTKPKQEKEDGEEEEEPEGKEPKEEENNSKSQLSSGRKRNPTNTPASQPFPKAPKTFESVPDTRKIISFLLSDQALKLLHNA